jgi:hypothetical protein
MPAINKSIERLVYTISKQNKPNNNDAEALNNIILFYNEVTGAEIKKNLLFVKLYIFLYSNFIKSYQSEGQAQIKIHEILDTDIDVLFLQLKDDLDTLEITDFFKRQGIENENIIASENKINEIKELNKQRFKKINITNFKNEYQEIDIETIKDNLTAMINLSLRMFNK